MALMKVALVLAFVAVANATFCPIIWNYRRDLNLNAISGKWHAQYLATNGSDLGWSGDCITYYGFNTQSNPQQIAAVFCGPRNGRNECGPGLGSGTVTQTNKPGRYIYNSNGVDLTAYILDIDEEEGLLVGYACSVINKQVEQGFFAYTRGIELSRRLRARIFWTAVQNGINPGISVRINQREDCSRPINC